MKSFFTFILRRHPVLTGVLAIAVVAVGVFAHRFVADAIYFADPANHHRTLELWMSPRYVGQSWDLPRPMVLAIMQMDQDGPQQGGPPTIAGIIDRTGMTLSELQTRVEAASALMRLRGAP